DQCRAAMASAWKAKPEVLYPTAGSELAIRHLPNWIPAKKVGLAAFSYGDHVAAWRSANCELKFAEDPAALVDHVDVLVVVNPNNPDGRMQPLSVMEALLARLREKGGTLIVDEAFIDLVPEHSLCAKAGTPGLVILRSTGKFYGLAGLRLGALLAEPGLIERWREFAGCWSVSGPALEIGARIHGDAEWASNMRQKLADWAKTVRSQLNSAGIEIVGGTDLFTLVRVEDACKMWEGLARQGIYVRRFQEKPDVLRIGLPADEAALGRLMDSLRLCL
ncbi:MAG: aminotransferase class I/II-fold pyridoxal phosphate-dependent enzyme, partial [Rhodospirillales bacterium]|nr:aminotransferase class I/II-fold pyridoxal phosphate-dependent enzyme [Rhodospirillales bacterium]